MKLLLLTIGLCVVNAVTPNNWPRLSSEFKPEQINGKWFSIAVVSNKREETTPSGPRRFQIDSFQAKKNGEIKAITYTNWNNICEQANITLTETKIPCQYKVNDLEDNYFLMEDTDYTNFLIVYCQIGKNGIWELFGRNKYISRVFKKKFENKIMSRGLQKQDISYFREKERCPNGVIKDSKN
ncbi:trichosurin-like [Vombatus ursinus]|uniref:trichosurin-like n=1 Tax=Vombatus ursinus TaxID=29139 RepID=UPI000FFD069A|nr:trichosurin-like [Vombatus ursinus]